MSRGPANFRQRDLDRAIETAQKRGLTDYELIIEKGRVILRVGSLAGKPVAETEEIIL
jgi:hypothetical protein